MNARLVTAAAILFANLGIGVVAFFFLLVALNGFSERVATYAFAIYIVGAVTVSVVMTVVGFFAAGVLLKREWNAWLAGLASFVVFVAIGVVLKLIVIGIAAAVADGLR